MTLYIGKLVSITFKVITLTFWQWIAWIGDERWHTVRIWRVSVYLCGWEI